MYLVPVCEICQMFVICFWIAVLVWLNYKNAYEYWNEQRMALNKEVQTATEQVLVKLPLSNLTQTAVPALGTLFLQLTVDDLGMCLPLNPFTQVSRTCFSLACVYCLCLCRHARVLDLNLRCKTNVNDQLCHELPRTVCSAICVCYHWYFSELK